MAEKRDTYAVAIMEMGPKRHTMTLPDDYRWDPSPRRPMGHGAWERRAITKMVESISPAVTTIVLAAQAQANLQDLLVLWMYHSLQNLQYRIYFDRPRLAATSGLNRRIGSCYEKTDSPSSGATKVRNVTPSSSLSSYTISRPLKRHRDSNDRNDDNGGRPPKRSQVRGDLSSCHPRNHLFACHFNKYSPSTYCALSSNKYLSCAGPGWENIVSLKNHLRDTHRTPLLGDSGNRYCSDASDPDSPCIDGHSDTDETEPSGDEGIDPLQWQKIIRLISRKSAAERKWFEIWSIIFPHVPSPDQPWYEFGPENGPGYKLGSFVDSPCASPTPIDSDSAFADVLETSVPSSPTGGATTPSLVSNGSSSMSWESTVSVEELTRPFDPCFVPYGPQDLFTLSFEDMVRMDGSTNQFDGDITPTYPDILRVEIPRHLLNSELDYISRHELFCPQPVFASGSFALPQLLERSNPQEKAQNSRVYYCNQDTNQESTVIVQIPPTVGEDSASVKSPDVPEGDGHDLIFDPGTGSPTEYGYEYNAVPDTIEAIESSIKEALSAEPETASRLIPIFREKWKRENVPLSPGVLSCATSDDNYSHYSTPNVSSSIDSSKRVSESQTKPKLQLNKRPNDEEGEGEDEDRLPKRSKKSRDIGNPYTGPKFACHFHKYNPKQYCVRKDPNLTTSEQIRWRICGGQGSKDLRHLMDGDLKHHRIHDCEECFGEFNTADDYRNHKLDKACDGTKPIRGPSRDGIDCLKWREIEKVKRSQKSDEEKWMDIWTILFPDAPRPRHPFASEDGDDTQLPPSSFHTEELLSTWRILIRDCIKHQGFQGFDEKTHQLYELQLRNALQLENQKLSRKRQPSSILTPSSSGRPPYTPFSESHYSANNATPSRHVQSNYSVETPAPSNVTHRQFQSPAGQSTSELSPNASAIHTYDVENQQHNGLKMSNNISPGSGPIDTPSSQRCGDTTTQRPSTDHWTSVDGGYSQTTPIDPQVSPPNNPPQQLSSSAASQSISRSGLASSDQVYSNQCNSPPRTPAKGSIPGNGTPRKMPNPADDRILVQSIDQRLIQSFEQRFKEMEAMMSAQQAKIMEQEASMRAIASPSLHNITSQSAHLDRPSSNQELYRTQHSRASNPIRRPPISSSPQMLSNFSSPTSGFLTNDAAPSRPQLWITEAQDSSSLALSRVPSTNSRAFIQLENGGIAGSMANGIPSSIATNMTGEVYPLYTSNGPSTNGLPSFGQSFQQQLYMNDANFPTNLDDQNYSGSPFIGQGNNQMFQTDPQDGDLDPNYGNENGN